MREPETPAAFRALFIWADYPFRLLPLVAATGLNSLSQSLTALPAPSGREPLARPETLHFSQKLCRHAKGPIPEGAVERMRDWGSLGKNPFRQSLRLCHTPPFVAARHLPPAGGSRPSRGRLLVLAGDFAALPKGVPLGELAANNVSRLRGYSCAIYPKSYPTRKSRFVYENCIENTGKPC